MNFVSPSSLRFGLLLSFSTALALVTACKRPEPAPPPSPAAPASAEKTDQVTVETEGTVETIAIRIGDPVRRGQVIANLNQDQAAEALRLAQRAYAAAENALIDIRKNYLKQKYAHENGTLSDADWAVELDRFRAAEKDRTRAASALSEAQNAFVRHDIVCRTDGIVTELNIEPGGTVRSGEVVAVVMPERE
ncbi:MAG: biotin/lipoyl-binding protein [Kiritimatiellae bacterium]|nr:biotin/lipoyl-binding protein [Kiritimatiellia bacterium]